MRLRIATVLALVLASVLAIALYLRMTSDLSHPGIETNPSPIDSAGDARSPATLVVPAMEGARSEADRRAVALAPASNEHGSAEVSFPAPTPANAKLVIHCVAKSGGTPLEGIRVSVWKREKDGWSESEDIESTHGTLDKSPITGRDGEVEFDLPSGVELHLFARAAHDDAGNVDQELPAFANGEQRALVLEIAAGDDLRFQGLVLARETHAPVAGAKVLVLRNLGTSPRDEDHGAEKLDRLAEATTADDGRFDLATSSWKQPFVRVDAEGFGPVLFAPSANHASRATARVILLDRSATIEATVVDTNTAPLADVTVEVVAAGNELQPKDSAFEFDAASVAEVRWSQRTAGDGRCTLSGLATNVRLRIVLSQHGRVVQREVEPVRLEPGETRALQWTIGSGCKLTGKLVDQEKRPIAHRELWLVRASSSGARYLDAHQSYPLQMKTSTDGSGRFTFANIGAGPWWIGPAPVSTVGAAVMHDAVPPYAKRIEVPSGTHEMDIVVSVELGLYIRGRVLDSSGAGAPDISVTAGMEGKLWGMTAQSGADGEFSVGPLMPGKFQMVANGNGTDADSDRVDAQAGATGVTLKLKVGGIIEGRVVDENGQGCRAGISISAQHTARFALQLMGTRDDGSFVWQSLEPGAYDLVARLSDGRVAVARSISLSAGAHVSNLVLQLEPGAKLRLRFTGQGAAPWYKVRSESAVVESDSFEQDRTPVVVVPKGKISIELHIQGDERVERREIELAAGDDKELVFGGAR